MFQNVLEGTLIRGSVNGLNKYGVLAGKSSVSDPVQGARCIILPPSSPFCGCVK